MENPPNPKMGNAGLILPDGATVCDFCDELAIATYGKNGRPLVRFCENHYLKTFNKFPAFSAKYINDAEPAENAWWWGAASGFLFAALCAATVYLVKAWMNK